MGIVYSIVSAITPLNSEVEDNQTAAFEEETSSGYQENEVLSSKILEVEGYSRPITNIRTNFWEVRWNENPKIGPSFSTQDKVDIGSQGNIKTILKFIFENNVICSQQIRELGSKERLIVQRILTTIAVQEQVQCKNKAVYKFRMLVQRSDEYAKKFLTNFFKMLNQVQKKDRIDYEILSYKDIYFCTNGMKSFKMASLLEYKPEVLIRIVSEEYLRDTIKLLDKKTEEEIDSFLLKSLKENSDRYGVRELISIDDFDKDFFNKKKHKSPFSKVQNRLCVASFIQRWTQEFVKLSKKVKLNEEIKTALDRSSDFIRNELQEMTKNCTKDRELSKELFHHVEHKAIVAHLLEVDNR